VYFPGVALAPPPIIMAPAAIATITAPAIPSSSFLFIFGFPNPFPAYIRAI